MDTPVGVHEGTAKGCLEDGNVVSLYNVSANVSGEALRTTGVKMCTHSGGSTGATLISGLTATSAQYTPIQVRQRPPPQLETTLVHKRLTIGSHGFPTNVAVNTTKPVKGKPIPVQTSRSWERPL